MIPEKNMWVQPKNPYSHELYTRNKVAWNEGADADVWYISTKQIMKVKG